MTSSLHTAHKMIFECVYAEFKRALIDSIRKKSEAIYTVLASPFACDTCTYVRHALASVGVRVNTGPEMPLRALATPAGATPPNLAREPWLTFSVPATTTSRSARPAIFPPSVSRASLVKRSARRTSCAPSVTSGRSAGLRPRSSHCWTGRLQDANGLAVAP